jgi:hypothetical protein
LILAPGEVVAGISPGMEMDDVIKVWGKPRAFWANSERILLRYNRASLIFKANRLTEVWKSSKD